MDVKISDKSFPWLSAVVSPSATPGIAKQTTPASVSAGPIIQAHTVAAVVEERGRAAMGHIDAEAAVHLLPHSFALGSSRPSMAVLVDLAKQPRWRSYLSAATQGLLPQLRGSGPALQGTLESHPHVVRELLDLWHIVQALPDRSGSTRVGPPTPDQPQYGPASTWGTSSQTAMWRDPARMEVETFGSEPLAGELPYAARLARQVREREKSFVLLRQKRGIVLMDPINDTDDENVEPVHRVTAVRRLDYR